MTKEGKVHKKMERSNLTTLCYIEKDGCYLMLHRVVKKKDVNKDKWIGVGGHFLEGESPEECLLREVKEETGLTLTSFEYRGLITFASAGYPVEYISLFTADQFTGDLIDCDEGTLTWVKKEDIGGLNLWEGDRIFFDLLLNSSKFFSLKFSYEKDRLVRALLNGKNMELFDILDEEGKPTGKTRERSLVHAMGTPHGTSHVWIGRKRNGRVEVLFQKRSAVKDSHPGCYDISSAGHIAAGQGPLETAVRELSEELGILADPEKLYPVGNLKIEFEEMFYGKPFHDVEFPSIYLYTEPVDINSLSLQEEEVEEVMWMDYEKARAYIEGRGGEMGEDFPHCVNPVEFAMIREPLYRLLED